MGNEIVKLWLECPNCKEGFVHAEDNSGKNALGMAGAATGATVGSKIGLGGFVAGAITGTKVGAILGPVGLVAGIIGGGVTGLILGKKFGDKFDKPQCPKCGVKFSIPE